LEERAGERRPINAAYTNSMAVPREAEAFAGLSKTQLIQVEGAQIGMRKAANWGVNGKIQAWVQERLEWEDWERLLKATEMFAKQQIRRRWWRGRKGGVLPEGQDASSIAAEVAIKLLSGKGRLAPGWTRERLQKELNRLASNEIRRLYTD